MSALNGKITRKELYLLIWKTPISTLEKENNIPIGILKGICSRLEIPTPESGYWSKLKFNKEVVIPPLPELKKDNIETGLKVVGDQIIFEEHFQTAFYRIKKEIESKYSNFLIPSEKLSKLHYLIKAAKADLKTKKPSGYYYSNIKGTVHTSKGIFYIDVSKENVPKALRFLDSFIKLLELRGHQIKTSDGSKVFVNGETINIRCREILKRIKIEDKDSSYSWERTELVPSGILSFEISADYSKKEWREASSKTLESKLSNIIASLELKAKKMTEERIEMEASWERMRIERELREKLQGEKDAELKQFNSLFNDATRWHKSQYIRNYIKEFEKYNMSVGSDDDKKNEWIQWAKEKADWFDPFIEKEVELLKGIDRDNIK